MAFLCLRVRGRGSGTIRQPKPGPQRVRETGASLGRAGFDIVPHRRPGTAAPPAQCHTGLPREERCGLLSRLGGRPPAYHRRGRSPSKHHPRDHADGATLRALGRQGVPAPQKAGDESAVSTPATVSKPAPESVTELWRPPPGGRHAIDRCHRRRRGRRRYKATDHGPIPETVTGTS